MQAKIASFKILSGLITSVTSVFETKKMESREVQIEIDEGEVLNSTLLSDTTKPTIEIPARNSLHPSELLTSAQEHHPMDQPEIFKFSWNATETTGKEFKYDRKNCCMNIAGLYAKCPLLLRYALYSLTGTAFIMIPGLVSFFLFVGNKDANFADMKEKDGGGGVFTINGVPIFVWSV